jgi:hypothetical protein
MEQGLSQRSAKDAAALSLRQRVERDYREARKCVLRFRRHESLVLCAPSLCARLVFRSVLSASVLRSIFFTGLAYPSELRQWDDAYGA